MWREFNAPSQKSQHVFGEQSKLQSSPSWIQGLSKNSSFALGRLPNTTICKSNNVHELTSWRDEQCPGTRLSGHLGRLVSHRGLQPKKKPKERKMQEPSGPQCDFEKPLFSICPAWRIPASCKWWPCSSWLGELRFHSPVLTGLGTFNLLGWQMMEGLEKD